TGVVAGPAGSRSLYPYFRAGIGAYRDVEIRNIAYPLLALEKPSVASINGVEVEERWEPGASVGVGIRLGPPGIPAGLVEARIHLTRLNGDDHYQLLVVSGGVWFR